MSEFIAMTVATTVVGIPVVIFAWWLVRRHDKEQAKFKEQKDKQDSIGQ